MASRGRYWPIPTSQIVHGLRQLPYWRFPITSSFFKLIIRKSLRLYASDVPLARKMALNRKSLYGLLSFSVLLTLSVCLQASRVIRIFSIVVWSLHTNSGNRWFHRPTGINVTHWKMARSLPYTIYWHAASVFYLNVFDLFAKKCISLL